MKDGLYTGSYGDKWWFKGGEKHRSCGPAIEYKDGDKEWWENDKRHRIGGPAIEFTNGTKFWFLYGMQYEESDYNKWMSNIPLLYWNRFKGGGWL